MTTFDKREEGFEAKFAYDEEVRFKIKSLRNRLIGGWAAEKMGFSDKKVEEYANLLFEKGLGLTDEQILQTVYQDLLDIGTLINKDELAHQMNVLHERARQEIVRVD